MDYALWLFLMEFTSPWTWTLILARTMRFSPHTEDWKLTLVQICERYRMTWPEHDQWKMTPPSWPVSSVRKAVRRTELSLSLSSVYLDGGLKSFFLLLTWELFCRWIESSVNVVLFLCAFKIRNLVELFLPGFLSLRLLRSKLQELFCRRNSIHN